MPAALRYTPCLLALTTLLALLPAALFAQTPASSAPTARELDELERQRAAEEAARRRQMEQALARNFDVDLQGASLKEAFALWSKATDVPVLMNWEALEGAGVDGAARLTMTLQDIPAREVLDVLMREAASDQTPLVMELTPWYLRIETRERANRRVQRRVYPIEDLLHAVPNFGTFHTSLSVSVGGRRVRKRLSEERRVEIETTIAGGGTRAERGEAIAELVRELIEPDLWREHGGDVATLRYFQGSLIVSAPSYVHVQIESLTGRDR